MRKKSTAIEKRMSTELQSISKASLAPEELPPHLIPDKISYPEIDIVETYEELLVIVDIPGVTETHLQVNIEEDLLTIEGLREKICQRDPDENYTGHEIVKYVRKFQIGTNVQKDKIDKIYQDGVLKLTLLKTEPSIPKKFEPEAE